MCLGNKLKFIQVRLDPRAAVKLAAVHGSNSQNTHKNTSCYTYCFSNIHIFHDVHQYNKTLIDLHYNYFMYFCFSFSLLSFTLTQPCLSSNPIPKDGTINLSINKSKRKEERRKIKEKMSTLPMILQSCPSCKARWTGAIWAFIPKTPVPKRNQNLSSKIKI